MTYNTTCMSTFCLCVAIGNYDTVLMCNMGSLDTYAKLIRQTFEVILYRQGKVNLQPLDWTCQF